MIVRKFSRFFLFWVPYMLEQKKAPFIPPRVVNVLHTPSSCQYVYFQPFSDKLEFTVTGAASDVHVLFCGKGIERELALCTAGTTTSEIRTSKAGSPLASTEMFKIKPSGSSISIVWDSAKRVFEVTVDGATWTASLPAGAGMPPFTQASFSTGGGVNGTFVLNNDPSGSEYGYGNFVVPKPVAKEKPKGKKAPVSPVKLDDVPPVKEEEIATPVEATVVDADLITPADNNDEDGQPQDQMEKKPLPSRKTRGRKKNI